MPPPPVWPCTLLQKMVMVILQSMDRVEKQGSSHEVSRDGLLSPIQSKKITGVSPQYIQADVRTIAENLYRISVAQSKPV